MGSSRPDPKTAEAAAALGAALPTPPRRVIRQPAKSPRRRTTLSLEQIVEAAIVVLDEAGVVGLSMRRVAEQLGTGAAYAYVSGKDELLELVFDELVGRVELPTEPDPKRWREQTTEMLTDLRAMLLSHRDAALAGLGRIPTSPQTLAAAEALSATLRAGGLSDKAVALGLDLLILYVAACAFEAGLYEHGGMTPDEMERYFEEIHTFYNSLPADRFPILASVAPSMTGFDAEDRFQFGLGVILAGLEAVSKDD